MVGGILRTGRAFVKINRLPTTLWYNVAYFLIGGALAGAQIRTDRLDLAVAFVCATFLVKMQASIADAIHDQQADAANPGKSSIARAVMVLGGRVSWSLLVFELVVALGLFGYVAVRTGDLVFLVVGMVFALLGFGYSYPPRLKERGVVNHVVTTGTDVGFVVLAFAYLLSGSLTTRAYVVAGVIFLYTFAYHLMHQAADTYYDVEAGIETFSTRAGAPRTIAVAGLFTAFASGIALAIGCIIGALALLVTVGFYVWLYTRARTLPFKEQTDFLADRFHIGWVATALNSALTASIVRIVFDPDLLSLL